VGAQKTQSDRFFFLKIESLVMADLDTTTIGAFYKSIGYIVCVFVLWLLFRFIGNYLKKKSKSSS
jgi:hypothetical protein